MESRTVVERRHVVTNDEDRMVTKVQWLYPVGLRISGHRAAGIFIDFTEEPNSLRINSTSAIHKSCAASCKHPRKWSAARKIQLKIPHQRSPWALKFEENLRRRLKGTVKCKQQKRRPCMSNIGLTREVKLLEDTLAVLSLGNSEDHGHSYE